MWLLLNEKVIEDNLKEHGKEVPEKAKLVKGQKRWRSLRLRKNLQRSKSKRDKEKKLDSICSDVQAEESMNSVNTCINQ